MHWPLFPRTPTPSPQASSKRESSNGWGCSNTSLYLEHPAAFSTPLADPRVGPGGLPPPPFPSCGPSGSPQQPVGISVTLLYYLQGVFPEAASALPGRLPVLFKCLNPATLHKIGAPHEFIHSWGSPGNAMGSRLSNAHFVNSSFYRTSLLKAKVRLSDLKLQGLGEPVQGFGTCALTEVPTLLLCFPHLGILNIFEQGSLVLRFALKPTNDDELFPLTSVGPNWVLHI